MGCQPAGVGVPFFSSLLGIWSLKSRVGGGQEASEHHVAATIVTLRAVTQDRAQAHISGSPDTSKLMLIWLVGMFSS